MLPPKQQASAARAFAQRWAGRGYEKGESQSFWLELLHELFGIEQPTDLIQFEKQVRLKSSTKFIDAYLPATRVLIEQKSLGRSLTAPDVDAEVVQGKRLSPFGQAKFYNDHLPYSERVRWIVLCNFAEMRIYDMERPNAEPEVLLLANLPQEYHHLSFLVDSEADLRSREMQVSMQAGRIVGDIYDALLRAYGESDARTLRWLNILCVRLVFLLYAEDAGIFRRNQFHDYLFHRPAADLRRALLDLFLTLNTPAAERSHYLEPDLAAFPYTNGGLFAEEIEVPRFSDELKHLLLRDASSDFDWSDISPTIFGGLFESTLNPATRRSGGMHYTSIENIHKAIDPLFLTALRRALDDILQEKVERTRRSRLLDFQRQLASLRFLDPACGSGNFLTETYLSLRRLENRVIAELARGGTAYAINPVQVSISQFYGIEVNDFAVSVATTALWIAEAQMLAETERIVQHDLDFLPLRSKATILEGNSLRLPWPAIGANASKRWQLEDKSVDQIATFGNVASYDGNPAVGANASKRWQFDDNSADQIATFGNVASYGLGGVTDLKFLDRKQYVHIHGTSLPHWHQSNKVQFVTFRLADSLPQTKLAELKSIKQEWLITHPEPWSPEICTAFEEQVGEKINYWIDQSYGSCLLKTPALRDLVEEALGYYHEKRYLLHAYVIMPNHVHVLLSPIGDDDVIEAIGSVKQYAARRINALLGRTGELWQRNMFDRMVRSQQEYVEYVQYIIDNPKHLPAGSYTIGANASKRWQLENKSETNAIGANVSKRWQLEDNSVDQVATFGNVASYDVGANASKRWELENKSVDQIATFGNVASYEAHEFGVVDYIIGNPPFVGARLMSSEQKQDLIDLFGAKYKNVGNLDYVCGWYKKAADYMLSHPATRTALVSTNSICQGEQVANLWQPLMQQGFAIDFAHRTFRWDSESSSKAHVHCVIVGFSKRIDSIEKIEGIEKPYIIFDGDRTTEASHINAYLLDAPDIFISSRTKPLCDVPQMIFGNMANDGSNLILSEEEKDELFRTWAYAEKYIRPFVGAEEFINGKRRYCLWLLNANPAELRKSSEVMHRVEAVRELRAKSSRAGTRKMADYPTLFGEIRQSESNYLLVPRVSSEKREYVPIGFLSPEVIASDAVQVIPNATLAHFAVLESSVHMAWMRAVCGRLKSDYRYSKDIVYNNFPWPDGFDKLATAQAILDARALYPDSSLADLYDPLTMPAELRRAHAANDRAVLALYSLSPSASEEQILATLFERYKRINK